MSGNDINVLVVDDDAIARLLLHEALKPAGYTVVLAESAEAMFTELHKQKFQLIFLDVRLPGMDGLDATRLLREMSDVGLILVSVRNEPTDRARGVELGADDYIGKPFDSRELRARAQSVLRRTLQQSGENDLLMLGSVGFDVVGRCLKNSQGITISLTIGEAAVLAELHKHQGAGVHRERLQAAIAGANIANGGSRSLDTLLSRLRSKLSEIGANSHHIASIRQFGYRLDSQPDCHADSERLLQR